MCIVQEELHNYDSDLQLVNIPLQLPSTMDEEMSDLFIQSTVSSQPLSCLCHVYRDHECMC